jgi:hypothetical protein
MTTNFNSNITIDLGNMSTTLDDYSIFPPSFSNIDWTTTPLQASSLPSTITLTGAQGSTGGYTFTSSASAGSWGTTSYPTSVKIGEDGIDLKEGADIKIGNRSLVKFMETLEQRLAILQPDPEKLEQFAALKAAYEHYKLLEALCSGPIPKDPNSV